MWKVKEVGDELRVELGRLGLENRFSIFYVKLKFMCVSPSSLSVTV